MTNGKGSKPRPKSISCEEYGDNYDAIFRKKVKKQRSALEKAEEEYREYCKEQRKLLYDEKAD
jgi:hypothetical protein